MHVQRRKPAQANPYTPGDAVRVLETGTVGVVVATRRNLVIISTVPGAPDESWRSDLVELA